MPLWHAGRVGLPPGYVIEPGSWGAQVRSRRSPYFRRENELERYRRRSTQVTVSRLMCAFAFERRGHAEAMLNSEPDRALYAVIPAVPGAIGVRADFDFVELVSEAVRAFGDPSACCRSYWAGERSPGGQGVWEWLYGCGLVVLERMA
jgi:hypothetical protein